MTDVTSDTEDELQPNEQQIVQAFEDMLDEEETAWPKVRYYEPIFSEDLSVTVPLYYELAVENDYLPPRCPTPDYETWGGEWEAKIKSSSVRMLREPCPRGYVAVIFVDSDKPEGEDSIIYEAFLPSAPQVGHMLNDDGKYYIMTDVTWLINHERYATTVETYLMIECNYIGDADAMNEHQENKDAAAERRKAFTLHVNKDAAPNLGGE